MANEYVLDTNIYITALRDPRQLALLKRFRMGTGPRVLMNAVVALELRAGAITPKHVEAVDALIESHATRDRVIVPSFDAYIQAGRVIAAVATRERMPLGEAPRSFVNDVILAASCREAGVVLLTENASDFARIQRHLRGFRFSVGLPHAGRGKRRAASEAGRRDE